MLAQVSNTLRVIVDGPATKEDENLIPSALFGNTFNFDDAVVELLQGQDGSAIYDFIRLCVAVDTITQYYSEMDDEGTGDDNKVSDLHELLGIITDTFACSENVYSAKIMEGTVNRNPKYSGLTGRFLQGFEDNCGEGELPERMAKLLDAFKNLCKDNPSITEVWWLDTLKNIYHRNGNIDEDTQENWYSENDGGTNSETIQLWYLKINPALHHLVSLISDVIQNESPSSTMTKVLAELSEQVNLFIEGITHPVVVCERGDLDYLEFPTTIEDVTIGLLEFVGDWEEL